jgi:hypothetical protein
MHFSAPIVVYVYGHDDDDYDDDDSAQIYVAPYE